MAGTRNGGKEKLPITILDPSREVAPNYFACAVDTKEGDSYTGIIVHETASSVTVRQPLGNEVLVPRSRIAKIQAQSTSLIKSSTALEAEVFRHDSRSLDWPAIDSQRIPERYSLP